MADMVAFVLASNNKKKIAKSIAITFLWWKEFDRALF